MRKRENNCKIMRSKKKSWKKFRSITTKMLVIVVCKTNSHGTNRNVFYLFLFIYEKSGQTKIIRKNSLYNLTTLCKITSADSAAAAAAAAYSPLFHFHLNHRARIFRRCVREREGSFTCIIYATINLLCPI